MAVTALLYLPDTHNKLLHVLKVETFLDLFTIVLCTSMYFFAPVICSSIKPPPVLFVVDFCLFYAYAL